MGRTNHKVSSSVSSRRKTPRPSRAPVTDSSALDTPDLSRFPLFERVEIAPPVGELHWIVVRCSFDWKVERLGSGDSAYRWLGYFGSLEEAKAAAMRDAARFGGGVAVRSDDTDGEFDL